MPCLSPTLKNVFVSSIKKSSPHQSQTTSCHGALSQKHTDNEAEAAVMMWRAEFGYGSTPDEGREDEWGLIGLHWEDSNSEKAQSLPEISLNLSGGDEKGPRLKLPSAHT